MATKPSSTPPIADALVHFQCAYTSLALLSQRGVLLREVPVFARLCPLFKRVVMATYGEAEDADLAQSLKPKSWRGTLSCVSNDAAQETAIFQSSVPRRVLEQLKASRCKSALVYADQHHGGEVAAQTARLLRQNGLRVGLVARCGYHWSWTVARDTAPHDQRAIAASMLEGDLCRAADVVIATTRRIADNLCWQHRLDADKLSIVPNFVSRDGQPPPFGRRAPGTVLYVGRLEPEKRVELLIRATAMAARTNPAIRLIIIGDGSLSTELHTLAAAFHAPVEFRARVPHAEILREMGRCNIYAQVSRFEGHPKTILEAMSTGAPTIVTRGPGVDDEINPNVTGLVVGDAESDIAAALVWLSRNPDAARRMGARASRDILSRLSFPILFRRLESCLRSAMVLAGDSGSIRPPVSIVRWEQTLLEAGPDGAAAEFASSVGAYVKRLDPHIRKVFLNSLAARVGSLHHTPGMSESVGGARESRGLITKVGQPAQGLSTVNPSPRARASRR